MEGTFWEAVSSGHNPGISLWYKSFFSHKIDLGFENCPMPARVKIGNKGAPRSGELLASPTSRWFSLLDGLSSLFFREDTPPRPSVPRRDGAH